MTNGGCYIAFSDPGTACDQQVLLTGNKRAFGQTHDLVTFDTPVGMVMDIFNHRLVAEPGIIDLPLHTSVMPVIPFSINQMG
ncbi:hypothetical protein D3C86_1754330 [compost metagenome]